MRRGLLGILAAGVLLASAPAAEAFAVTPSTGTLDVTRWEDQPPTTNDQPGAIAEASTECSCDLSDMVYNDESGGTNGSETITADVTGQVYLFVKDGANFPAWYLFDLTALGWNGTDTLDLSGFWPDNGEISHVSLYDGIVTTTTPEPATLSLFAFGLLGLGAMRRKTVPSV